MSDPKDSITRALLSVLSGKGAHVESRRAVDGLDWQVAGEKPNGVPYSILQVLNHIIYWQDLCLQSVRGEEAPIPKHAAEGWPGEECPQGTEEWQEAVSRFTRGLDGALDKAKKPEIHNVKSSWKDMVNFEVLHVLALHNSHHVGQIILLRRMLDAWPPPGGGDSW